MGFHDPIWLAHIFSNGLVKNHQLVVIEKGNLGEGEILYMILFLDLYNPPNTN